LSSFNNRKLTTARRVTAFAIGSLEGQAPGRPARLRERASGRSLCGGVSHRNLHPHLERSGEVGMLGGKLSAYKYAYLRTLIHSDMGQLVTKRPKVLKLLANYTTMSEARIRDALSKGHPPTVDITAKDQYEHTLPGIVIQIGRMFAGQYEDLLRRNAHKSSPDLARAAAAAVLLMESKLLHGLVHWGWGVMHPADPEPASSRGYNDFAWDFETDFYGYPLTATALGLKPKYIGLPGLP